MKRVMIVEDEAISAMMLQAELEAAGFEVVALESTGEGAVARAGSARPDILLFDIQLAGPMNGIEAAGRIRRGPAPALVFMTGYFDPEMKARALALGPQAFLVKPLDMGELVPLLKSF